MHENAIDQIRAKIDILDLVREYTELKKAGRNWKGLCPFHKERSPSFMVSPDKQIAYCFGCHKGGDIFAVVMEMERTDFPGALRALAEKAGVDLPEKLTHGPSRSQRETLVASLAASRQFYQDALRSSAEATAYFATRGLSDETIATFGLGYAPDSYDDLWKTLREQQYMTEDLVVSGMLSSSGNKYFNRFRHRVMFPIENSIGQTIAFAGRILGDGEPKYLNSPESPIYSKSHTLFNLHRAKAAIRTDDAVIVVEGYMDVISSWQQGVQAMVAPCGTALTKEQIGILRRHTDNIFLLYDADTAGQEAIIRNSLLCLEEDVHPRIVTLGDERCKDVDDYWKHHSPEEFVTRLDAAKPFMEHYLDMLLQTHNLDQVQRKRQAVDKYLEALRVIPNQIEVQEYLRRAALAFAVDGHVLLGELQKKLHPGKATRRVVQQEQAHPFASPAHVLAGILLTYPGLLREFPVLDHFPSLGEELPTAILTFVRKEADFAEGADLIGLLPEGLRDQARMLVLYIHDHGVLDDEEHARHVLTEKLRLLLETKKKELLTQMQTTQAAKDAKGWFSAYTTLAELQKFAL